MSDGPIRLTKGRANSLLIILEAGFDSELDSLKQAFGVRVLPSGEVQLDDEDFALLDPDQANELAERVAVLAEARAAQVIFTQRYA